MSTTEKVKSATKVSKRKNQASDEETSDSNSERAAKQPKKKARIANTVTRASEETPPSVNAAGSEGKPDDPSMYSYSMHLQRSKRKLSLWRRPPKRNKS